MSISDAICRIDGCPQSIRAKSLKLCAWHRERLRLYGDPLGRAPKRVAKSYPVVYAPSHPLATRQRGTVQLHRKVLFDHVGPGWHPCHWCGVMVEWRVGPATSTTLVVDHLDHDPNNYDLTNLMTSCNACNGHRQRGEVWEPWVPGTPVGRVDRHHSRCRKGHELAPDNVYIRPDTGSRTCLTCVRDRNKKGKTPEQRAHDAALKRERIKCETCGKLVARGGMTTHVRRMHNGLPTHCADLADRAGIHVERFRPVVPVVPVGLPTPSPESKE